MSKLNEFPGILGMDYFYSQIIFYQVVGLIAVLMISVNTMSSKDDHVQTDAPFMIRAKWPGKLNNDVDPYVRDPGGHIAFYKQRTAGKMSLSKDVIGSSTVRLEDGREVTSEYSTENVLLLGPIPDLGEYVVNVNLFRMTDGSPPTNVEVTLYKITQHHDIDIVTRVVTLNEKGQEETAFRFTLTNERGDFNIVDVKDDMPQKLISQ